MIPNNTQKEINERFEFRDIRPEEATQAVEIEKICFPPNEACSEKMMLARVAKAPELFLVAIDKQTGKIAGFINGLSTHECAFRDEFFTDADLHEPAGRTVMLLGVDVLPAYQRQGLANDNPIYLCAFVDMAENKLISILNLLIDWTMKIFSINKLIALLALEQCTLDFCIFHLIIRHKMKCMSRSILPANAVSFIAAHSLRAFTSSYSIPISCMES